MPRCLLWKRVPGYTIPMAPMHLPPMAPMKRVEQIRALPNACYAPRSSRSPGLLTMRLMWHASKRHVSKRHR
jgi:hypothetical protein